MTKESKRTRRCHTRNTPCHAPQLRALAAPARRESNHSGCMAPSPHRTTSHHTAPHTPACSGSRRPTRSRAPHRAAPTSTTSAARSCRTCGKSHHNTSHHITPHHITSRNITSRHIISHPITMPHAPGRRRARGPPRPSCTPAMRIYISRIPPRHVPRCVTCPPAQSPTAQNTTCGTHARTHTSHHITSHHTALPHAHVINHITLSHAHLDSAGAGKVAVVDVRNLLRVVHDVQRAIGRIRGPQRRPYAGRVPPITPHHVTSNHITSHHII